MNFFKHITGGAQWALLLTVGLVAVSGCKNYLDVAPQGQVTDANFFQTSSDAVLATNAVYGTMRINTFNEGLFPILDIMSDDGRKGSYPGDGLAEVGVPYDQFQVNANTADHADWYRTLYQGIRRANTVVERVPAISMDAKLKARLIGEAKFMRALFYLDLVRAFGDVQVILTTTPASLTVARTPARDVYNNIIKQDLTEAAQVLPAKNSPDYGSADQGRATSGAAHALLARAALFFKDYPTAATEATAVTDQMQGYALELDFRNAFRPAGNFGPESVFEVGSIGFEEQNGIDRGGNQYGNTQGVRGTPNRGWGFNRPSMGLLRSFTPGDPRKHSTYIQLGETYDGVFISGDGATPDTTFAMVTRNGLTFKDTLEFECYNRKVWTPGIDVNSQFGFHRRIIRYADVLLMAAEAVLEANGDAGRALGYLNQVRARSRAQSTDPGTVLPNITSTDVNEVRQAIYNERRWELALEGQRFFDLIRTGRATNPLKTGALDSLGFTAGKNELLPIPATEISLSGGTLTQNPGYGQ